MAWWRRLARQRPTSRLVRARRGWFRVARRCRCGLRLARLARTEICRRRRGLVGLAPHLGLGRLPLGVGSRFMGLGQPLGRRFNRRHRGPTVDCSAPTDLRGTSADCRRNPLYSPATRRSRPATHHRCSLGASDRTPAYWPATRRCSAAANRGATAARNCLGGRAAAHHLRPAVLRFFCGSTRPGLRDDRTRMVAWWLRGWRLRGGRGGCGDRSFRPRRGWIYRNT